MENYCPDAKIQKKMHYIQLYWYHKLNKNQNHFYLFLYLRFGGRWHSSVDTRLFPFTSRPTPQWSPLGPSALHRCIFYCVNEHWSYSTKTNNNNERKQCNVVFQGKSALHHCIFYCVNEHCTATNKNCTAKPKLFRYALKKKRYYLGIFPNMGGGGLPKSQNFCKFTKYFFVCQIHSEVLKHVLQMGG